MAGITARIMVNNGGARFGCINPILYANQEIFFDVVSGQNSGDGQIATCPSGASSSSIMGFTATSGWDPASGIGTLGTAPVGAYTQYQEILLNNTITPSPGPTSAAREFSLEHITMISSFLCVIFVSFVI